MGEVSRSVPAPHPSSLLKPDTSLNREASGRAIPEMVAKPESE